MERLSINAEKREEHGKGTARSLRREGMVPAVLYRAGKSQSIKLSGKELAKLINTISGEQVIVDLLFADGEKKPALLKEYQLDPVKGELLHTDFFEVSLTETVRVTVHVVTVGEPIGVKRDAGILQHALREVEIECLPDKIPGKIEVDIAKLELGQSVHVSDLKFEEGIKVLTDPGDVIVMVVAPVEEAAPAAEAAAVAAEPEVVKKGKKEEGAAEKKGK
ncbi:MAG: 50S ribosomal protein L25 [Nitrospiraceae bacterium]|nr:MAG: 50S ribosomal protein L25 [Nitrospiraceae bacterium]